MLTGYSINSNENEMSSPLSQSFPLDERVPECRSFIFRPKHESKVREG